MWQTREIEGHPVEMFLPERRRLDAAILFLPSFSGQSLQTVEEFRRQVESAGVPVLMPLVRENWWLDTPDPGFHSQRTPAGYIRDRLTEWIAAELGVHSPRIALMGISAGGQGALNLAYRHALQFPVVAAISPALDFHIAHGRGFAVERVFADAEAARQQTAILHLHPLNWPKFQFFCCDPLDPTWYAGCDRLASKLRSSGVPFESDLITSISGHDWTYFSRMAERAFRFVLDSLAKVGD